MFVLVLKDVEMRMSRCFQFSDSSVGMFEYLPHLLSSLSSTASFNRRLETQSWEETRAFFVQRHPHVCLRTCQS